MQRMICRLWVLGACAALGLPACAPGGDSGYTGGDATDGRDGHGDAVLPPLPDADGDTISDVDEGRAAGTDTDGDTTPDYLDTDSDGDGIPDSVEAGDADTHTPPVDSDLDGIPDFRDLDSDGNGIFDAAEAGSDPTHPTDTDGIGTPDFQSRDDDGDTLPDVLELGGTPAAPPDHDGDTIPDYHDTDSDGDTIADRDEGTPDTDGDTTPDRFDLDSDNDTIPDAVEAGDTDPNTRPIDSDGDGIFDFRDTDSDNDGLPDDQEALLGTDPTVQDTDGDTVDDMVEVAAGTDPLDGSVDPHTEGNFVFIEPYNDPADPPVPPLDPEPLVDTLVFSTNIQYADVYFLVDCTGSMSGEISNLRSSISGTVIPGINAAIPDAWIGVGHHDDVPVGGYGSSGDWGYENLQDVTSDAAAAQTAANNLPQHYGADGPESPIVAFYAIATGVGSRTVPILADRTCPDGYWGYPCFRDGAIPIIIEITDAPMHNGPPGTTGTTYSGFPAPTYDETIAALTDRGIRVIGVSSGDTYSHHDLDAVARATGAVDLAGNSLVYDIPATGAGLGDQVVNAVQTLASDVPLRIDAIPVDGDDPPGTDPPVDAVASFIAYLETNVSGLPPDHPLPGDTRICTVVDPPPVDGDGDTHPDYFPQVLPGTSVCFDIHPKQNWTVPAQREPQMFRATIQVMGDMITILDHRDVFFVVPPASRIIIGK